jgi:hypothetical protein
MAPAPKSKHKRNELNERKQQLLKKEQQKEWLSASQAGSYGVLKKFTCSNLSYE